MRHRFAMRRRVLGALLLVTANLWGCGRHEPADVEVEVRSVGFDNASNAPVVVLQDHDQKVAFPIWIGAAEAQAIAMQMQGISPPRPMTHDLLKSMLDGVGVEFQKVVIDTLQESTYHAKIYLHAGRQELQFDSRPSDAIALAVRFHRPIFVAKALLKGASSIDLQHEAAGAGMVKFSGVTLQNLTDELAEYFSVPRGAGVIVSEVASDAPEGLKRGDIILAIDGATVSGVGDFTSKMRAIRDGKAVQLSVQRGSERVPVSFTARAG